MKKRLLIPLIIILSLIIILFFVRLISHSEIDDVSPEIPCEQEYLEKSDIFWIIPKFNNKPISENKEWCNYILSLNKKFGLHGVTHKFNEFKTNKEQEYVQEGIDIFEECFGFKSEIFKPPQLKISKENKELIKQSNIRIKTMFNQITHKVYHCDDSGRFSNWMIYLF